MKARRKDSFTALGDALKRLEEVVNLENLMICGLWQTQRYSGLSFVLSCCGRM